MKKYIKNTKILDIVFICCTLIVIFLIGFYVFNNTKDVLYVKIEVNNSEIYMYRLDTDRIITIEGKIGTTVVEIQENTVRITDSPCPNKTCIAKNKISKFGEWIACLPNTVIVFITTK